jgi:hypothetical protein
MYDINTLQSLHECRQAGSEQSTSTYPTGTGTGNDDDDDATVDKNVVFFSTFSILLFFLGFITEENN